MLRKGSNMLQIIGWKYDIVSDEVFTSSLVASVLQNTRMDADLTMAPMGAQYFVLKLTEVVLCKIQCDDTVSNRKRSSQLLVLLPLPLCHFLVKCQGLHFFLQFIYHVLHRPPFLNSIFPAVCSFSPTGTKRFPPEVCCALPVSTSV